MIFLRNRMHPTACSKLLNCFTLAVLLLPALSVNAQTLKPTANELCSYNVVSGVAEAQLLANEWLFSNVKSFGVRHHVTPPLTHMLGFWYPSNIPIAQRPGGQITGYYPQDPNLKPPRNYRLLEVGRKYLLIVRPESFQLVAVYPIEGDDYWGMNASNYYYYVLDVQRAGDNLREFFSGTSVYNWQPDRLFRHFSPELHRKVISKSDPERWLETVGLYGPTGPFKVILNSVTGDTATATVYSPYRQYFRNPEPLDIWQVKLQKLSSAEERRINLTWVVTEISYRCGSTDGLK